jgi:hypothetical protein
MEIDAFLGHIFLFVWSIAVVGFGICGLFFREQFASLNIWWALKLYEMTGIPLFKTQAEHWHETDRGFLMFTLGLAAIIAGVLTFLSLFNVHIID